MEEEPKSPEHLTVHFKSVDGKWWEKRYIRYHQPDGSVKDYALPRGEKPCEGNGEGCPKEPSAAPTGGDEYASYE